MDSIGYIELLRRNSPFRRLFAANEISFIGDWFTVIALFILAGEATAGFAERTWTVRCTGKTTLV